MITPMNPILAAILTLLERLTPRRCQTCGKKVETYCHACEDVAAAGYGWDD